jgi:triacylglycerol lipase
MKNKINLPIGFNIDLAIELVELSKQAYKQYYAYTDGKIWATPKGYEKHIVFEAMFGIKKAPLGFIVSKGDDIYISWRGTADIEDLIQALRFLQVKASYLPGNPKVESGFHSVYVDKKDGDSPQEAVLNFLKEREVKGKIYVTGHSLGAALAILNILDIAENTKHRNLVLYSFAGPLVGSPEYATLYNNNKSITQSWRVVNTYDEISKIPFKDIEIPYKHVDKEIDIVFGGLFPWEWDDKHLLGNYIKQLYKLRDHINNS